MGARDYDTRKAIDLVGHVSVALTKGTILPRPVRKTMPCAFRGALASRAQAPDRAGRVLSLPWRKREPQGFEGRM